MKLSRNILVVEVLHDSLYDESGVMCYEYGNMGEVTKETRIYALPFLPQPLALSTLFEYDSWGRILNITYPDNEIVNYDYDLGGQLFRMYNNSSYNYLDNIIYDKFGAKTSQDYGNGIVTQYTYNDTTRRLSEIATNNGALINYTYDLVGNVTQVTSVCPWLQNQSFTENFSYDSTDQLISANEAQSYQLAVNYGNWGKIMQYDLTQTDMLNNATSQISRSLTYPSHANNVGNSQTPFAPTMQNGDEDVFFTFGINGSLRKREVQTPNPHTEYYLFNSQGNLKAYSDDIMSFAYYGYNAANTRTYKISLYNTNVWINGQQQPLNMQLQNAMFYPNTYLNFDAFGNYTKHYYNGMERIASRLGDNTTTIAISNNILEDRKLQLEEQFRVDIHKLIYETVPIDLPPFMDVNALQPTGTPNDIFYYHPNHLGNTAFVTDQNQTITQGFLYAPFGEITTEYNVNFGNNVIPKYSFNAKELDEETGMYYYEARYYKPPVFTSRDPMFEKYFWMTPYAYCANNPVKYVDPSGRKVEPAGEEEANAYNEFKANAPDHVRAELTRLEDAEEVFRIRMGDNITCTAGEGNFVYNTTTEEFDINILDGSDYSTMEKLSHELKHADQYMDRKIGFDLKELTGIKGDIALPIPYDRRNEYEAYARQSLFSASGKVVSRQKIFESYPNLIEYKTPITIDNLDIPGYNFQGIKDHNSKVYNKYGKPRFMYHGWKDDIEK